MIDSQLRTSGINDAGVLQRMAAVAREAHVPDGARGVAYMDRGIAFDDGRHIAAPVFYGMALQEARPEPSDEVLVVDGGSGYLPALVEPLVKSVKAITPEQALGSLRGTFSLILIDGAVEQFPDTLTRRLAEDGRVVAGLIEDGGVLLTVVNLLLLAVVAVAIERVWRWYRALGLFVIGQVMWGLFTTFVFPSDGAGTTGATLAAAATLAGLWPVVGATRPLLVASAATFLLGVVLVIAGDAHGVAVLIGMLLGAVMATVLPPVHLARASVSAARGDIHT